MSSDKLTIHTAMPPVTTSGQTRSNAVATKSESVREKQQAEVKTPTPDLKSVATRIEGYLKSVNRALEFKVDSASGRTVVTVRDAENGEIIRQIPNEEVLRFAQLAEEQTIVLLNEKV